MTETPTMFEALQEAVRRAGSQTAFAQICECSQPAVWKMLQSGKRLSVAYVLRVEKALGVSRHYTRPDIYPIADITKLAPLELTEEAPAVRRPRRRVAQAAACA